MNNIYKIKNKPNEYINKEIIIQGWIRKHRVGKKISFIVLSDGSTLKDIQVIYKNNNENYKEINKLFIGSAVEVNGLLVKAKNEDEIVELNLIKIKILSKTNQSYFLQNKEHGLEFLRANSELRGRSKLFQSIFSIRNNLFFSIHKYFQEKKYHFLTSPLITNNDCEGAGEGFFVNNEFDNKKLFFKKISKLTVSGQLHAEAFAQIFKNVYTFGPTFRADKSNTRFHASEFWMVEPEISFCNLNQCIDLVEDFLKTIIKDILEKNEEELKYLEQKEEINLINKLKNIISTEWKKINYDEIIKILEKNKNEFKNKNIKWEMDLEKEHEMFLCKYFKKPVFVKNFPKNIKSFYMKQNEDNKTVASFDLLFNEIGEMIGGSQREDNYLKLLKVMEEKNIDIKSLTWYVDLRKNGFAPSTGFGLGFDRLLMFITGIKNIRDVIPFYVGYMTLNY